MSLFSLSVLLSSGVPVFASVFPPSLFSRRLRFLAKHEPKRKLLRQRAYGERLQTFKAEEVYHENYETHEQAVRVANDYVERFYNPVRLHSALDYVSPLVFEQHLLLK